jgi:hypothetical protein
VLQHLRRVTHRPIILFAAVDRETAQISEKYVKERIPEKFSLPHKKDGTRQRELHREHVKIGDVIRRQNHRSSGREVL